MITPDAFDLFDSLIDEDSTGLASDAVKIRFVNLAIRDVIEDRIKPKDPRKPWSMQSDLRNRAELAPIYTMDNTFSVTNGYLDYPSDYKYPSYLRIVNQAGRFVGCEGVAGNVAAERHDDPHILIDEEPYCEVMDIGIKLYTGQLDQADWFPSSGELYYIKKWTEVDKVAGQVSPYEYEIGDVIWVMTGSFVHDGTTYTDGETFTITAGNLSYTGSGSSFHITNSELSDDLMREIVRLAAAQYLDTMDEPRKAMDNIADNFKA